MSEYRDARPTVLLIVFLTIVFGPSFLYALIADESSIELFQISLVSALLSIGILWIRSRQRKR